MGLELCEDCQFVAGNVPLQEFNLLRQPLQLTDAHRDDGFISGQRQSLIDNLRAEP